MRPLWLSASLGTALILFGCGGSSHSSPIATSPSATPKITVVWPARTRAIDAPSQADSVDFVFYDRTTNQKIYMFSGTRPSGSSASSQTYTAAAIVPKDRYSLQINFRLGSHLIASANVLATVAADGTVDGSDGKPLGPISLDTVINYLAIDPEQTLDGGQTKDLTVTSADPNGIISAVNYGALKFSVTDGEANLRVNADGSLTGTAEGDATVVAAIDSLKSAPVKVHVFGAPIALRSVSLFNADLVVNSTHDRFFASDYANNQVVPLDPASGTIGAPIAVGRRPGPLALSDDDSTVLVGSDRDYEIQSVDLATSSAGTPFQVVPGMAVHATSLAFQPGSRSTFATLLFGIGDPLTIFDGNVPRPSTAPTSFGGYVLWVSPTRVLASSKTDVQDFAVDSRGATLVRAISDGPNPVGRLVLAGGRLYTDNGSVYDAATLTKLGAFPLASDVMPGVLNFLSPAIDPVANRAYFIDNVGGVTHLHVYRLDDFTLVTDRHLTNTFFSVSSAGAGQGVVLSWGTSGLAFGGGDTVWLVDGVAGL